MKTCTFTKRNWKTEPEGMWFDYVETLAGYQAILLAPSQAHWLAWLCSFRC